MRLIDGDKLLRDIEHYHLSDGMFQHWVEVQQTIEPEQRWIPCSERLPEKAGLYAVSGGEKVWISEFAILGNTRGGWINSILNPTIKAWMPLPEPYDPLVGHMNPPEDE